MEPHCIKCGEKVYRCDCASEPLKCSGVSRVAGQRAIMVSFNRTLTDDELRFFDECSKRTASLMQVALS